MERIASATDVPCAVSTSTWRSFVTISSAVCLSVLIFQSSIRPKAISQGGPLSSGQTSKNGRLHLRSHGGLSNYERGVHAGHVHITLGY